MLGLAEPYSPIPGVKGEGGEGGREEKKGGRKKKRGQAGYVQLAGKFDSDVVIRHKA